MNKFILSILFIGIFSFANAQSAAQIKFVEEVHDFGELAEGPKSATEFKFTNTGKEPLIISSAKGSCGCTVPVWPKEPILPGKTGVIKVEYNTAGRPGPFTKTVTITSNAAEPTTVLKIKGNVVTEADEETMPVRQPVMMAPSK